MKRLWDDLIKGSTPMLNQVVILGFTAAVVLVLPTAIRFLARQFLLFWSRREEKKQKMNETEMEKIMNSGLMNRRVLQRQNFPNGLHAGGKEFSLLRSKNPVCETAGWLALL